MHIAHAFEEQLCTCASRGALQFEAVLSEEHEGLLSSGRASHPLQPLKHASCTICYPAILFTNYSMQFGAVLSEEHEGLLSSGRASHPLQILKHASCTIC